MQCIPAELKLAMLRLRMVHGTGQAVAKMFLVELAKGSRGDVTVEPPLIVYDGRGEYTEEAAAILNIIPISNQRRSQGGED